MKKIKLLLLPILGMLLAGCNDNVKTYKLSFDAEDIVMSNEMVSMDLYTTSQLNVSNSTLQQAVTWTVDDTSIVEISNSGLLTAKKVGVTTAHATYKDLTSTCQVTVYDSYSNPYIEVNYKDASLTIGSEVTIEARTYYKGDEVVSTYQFSAEDETVVSTFANENGIAIVGLKEGQTVVHVATTYLDKYVSTTVNVTVYKNNVAFEVMNATPVKGGYEVKLSVGETYTPNVKVYVDGELVNNPSIVYTSNNSEVLSYNGVTFNAVSAGEATILGQFKNTANLTIKVTIE